MTLKRFEAGHTYMSADSFHHRVEKKVARRRCPDEEDRDNVAKKSGSVYDFQDFDEYVANVGEVVRMEELNFYALKKELSEGKK